MSVSTEYCTQPITSTSIDQVYLQEYTAGQQLGFHYDNRRAFGEIICGLSLGTDSTLLLGATNGGGQLPDRPGINPRVRSVTVQANAVYVLSGVSRCDLRHAVDHRSR